ncbi:hypothetical protein KFU94_37250 [Chloroflexi bacterium TSY]|nr:hypothetical protein [Chloroflexi bacterium TSY]
MRYGRGFVEQILHHYTGPVERNFFARIDFEARRKLFFVVYFALKYGFDDHVPDIIEMIETMDYG